jgi:hypothetical protein
MYTMDELINQKNQCEADLEYIKNIPDGEVNFMLLVTVIKQKYEIIQRRINDLKEYSNNNNDSEFRKPCTVMHCNNYICD